MGLWGRWECRKNFFILQTETTMVEYSYYQKTSGEYAMSNMTKYALEASLKMLQYNAQACDILFNGLCPKEFNKISRLENAKEIWDTLIDMHEGTDSVKESKLDVLQS